MSNLDETTKNILLLLIGSAIFAAGQELRESTPNYTDLRNANEYDNELKQYMIDGEAHTGIIVAGAAVIAAWATQSLVPALALIGVYGALVWYQHSVYKSPAPVTA